MSPLTPSASSRELIHQVKKLIPPLLEKFHKGQHGRVAVLGGSEDYTGAPFFSANASALLGADLSHVICEPQAAQVIKTYSPNIMVHPYMRQSHHVAPHEAGAANTGDGQGGVRDEEGLDKAKTQVVERVKGLLDRLHSMVVGPGLGRDVLMMTCAGEVVAECRKRNIPVVVDADGLYLISQNPKLVHSNRNCILTPNVVEFARLCRAQGIDPSEGDPTTLCSRLAKSLGGVTIIQKGARDYISNGETTLVCDLKGGLKRSGGQGDTLTGCLGTFLAWGKAYREGLWEHDNSLTDEEIIALSAYGAAAVTRTCSRLAFEKKGRALQAFDLSVEVGNAFNELFGEDEPKL